MTVVEEHLPRMRERAETFAKWLVLVAVLTIWFSVASFSIFPLLIGAGIIGLLGIATKIANTFDHKDYADLRSRYDRVRGMRRITKHHKLWLESHDYDCTVYEYIDPMWKKCIDYYVDFHDKSDELLFKITFPVINEKI